MRQPWISRFVISYTLAAIVATGAASAGFTLIADGRRLDAQASAVPHDSPDSQSHQPSVAFSDYLWNVDASSFGFCEDTEGNFVSLFAETTASQDSDFTAVGFNANGVASASLPANGTGPGGCGPNSSTGLATSTFLVVFTTDTAYEFNIGGLLLDASVELSSESTTEYAFAGTGNAAFQEVLGPGTYTITAVAEADENFEDNEYDIWLVLIESTTGSPGVGWVDQLGVGKAAGSDLTLAWGPSCSSDDDDYAIYAGDLGNFLSHTLKQCGTGGVTTATITPDPGDRYYLVVPLEGSSEGSYGRDSADVERPVGLATCGTQDIASSCP